MSAIEDTFRRLSDNRSGGYIPYLCAGDPDCQFTIELARRMCRAGADILELGIPFSDPVADGPVIQEAMLRSLSAGFRVHDIFEILSTLRGEGFKQPVVVMSYFNPILKFGIARFLKHLAEAGGDGILVVDLPMEESAELDLEARALGLDVIRLVAPNTRDERIDTILAKTSGFAYLVSVAGVTGARELLADSTGDLVRRVTSRSSAPVALGFGISRPEHVRMAISAGAAAVVEGSGLVSTYAGLLNDRGNALDQVERHAREMKSAASPPKV
jgi:tryptophan synthase alpha chain